MRRILITGLIGSGKSEVSRILRSLSYPVYDSDSRTKALYESVPELVEHLEDALGVPYSEFGVIFEDASRRETLESMVYPLVIEDFAQFCKNEESPVFFESAVAYDKPLFRDLFDDVVLVRAPYELRLARNPKVALRSPLQSEMPLEKASYTIDNNGSLEALAAQVAEMIKILQL